MTPKTKVIIGVSAGAVALLVLLVWLAKSGGNSVAPATAQTNTPPSNLTLQEMPNVGPLETEKVWTVVTPTATNTTSYKEVSSPEMGQFWLKQGKKDENYYYFKNKSSSAQQIPFPFPPAPVQTVVTQQVLVITSAPPTVLYVTNTVVKERVLPPAPIVINVAAGAQASATATNGGVTVVNTNTVVTLPPPSPDPGEPPYWLRKLW